MASKLLFIALLATLAMAQERQTASPVDKRPELVSILGITATPSIDISITDPVPTKVSEVVSGLGSKATEAANIVNSGVSAGASYVKSEASMAQSQVGSILGQITKTSEGAASGPTPYAAEKLAIINGAIGLIVGWNLGN